MTTICSHKECLTMDSSESEIYNYQKLQKMRTMDTQLQMIMLCEVIFSDKFTEYTQSKDPLIQLLLYKSIIGDKCIHGNTICDPSYMYEKMFFEQFNKQELEIFITKHKSLKSACISAIYYSDIEIPDKYNIDQLFDIGIFI